MKGLNLSLEVQVEPPDVALGRNATAAFRCGCAGGALRAALSTRRIARTAKGVVRLSGPANGSMLSCAAQRCLTLAEPPMLAARRYHPMI